MFGRRSKGFVQIYEFGCRNQIIRGMEAALDQMERRVRLWNRFVAIEKEIRQRVHVLISDQAEEREINKLRSRVATLRGLILEKQKTEGHLAAVKIEELREQVSTTRAALSALAGRVRINKRERFKHSGDAVKELEEYRVRQVKQAQRESGLYWCNYDHVRQIYEVARVRAMRAGTELRAHEWQGAGQVSVRFQRGLPVAMAFTALDRRFQLDSIPPEAWTSLIRSTRRRLSRTRARIRVDSTPERSPVWFEIPVVIHRPMPVEGVIRRASVIRERLGLSWRYRLSLTIASAPVAAAVSAARPSIAIDVGWRIVPQGLRVAFWADSLGSSGTVTMPVSDLEEYAKVRGLRSLLGKALVQARSDVIDWQTRNRIHEELLPYFESVTRRGLATDLLELVNAWQKQRSGEGREVFERLWEWKRQYIHLWTWAVNLADQLARKRLELFRRFSAEAVKVYGTIFLERFDLRWLSRMAPPEKRTFRIDGRYRVIAAPGIFRQVIANVCRRTGVQLVRVQARNTTTTCHACGRIEQWNTATQLLHKCGCGVTWDQDYNAALQILRIGLAQTEARTNECDSSASYSDRLRDV